MPTNASPNFAANDELRAFWKAAAIGMMTGARSVDVDVVVTAADALTAAYIERVQAAQSTPAPVAPVTAARK